MIWLEMSRDISHGGGDWSFGKCLWSPTYKRHIKLGRTTQGYWDNMLNIKKGDTILHLRGKGENAKFLAQSIADVDGFKTYKRPPEPKVWDYSDSFYKVPLVNFHFLPFNLPLPKVFQEKDYELRNYYQKNRQRTNFNRKKLFYVIQSGRLQCQNGAYLSEVDSELFSILFQDSLEISSSTNSHVNTSTETSSFITTTKSRIGQRIFSANVRSNYNSKCCFPKCNVVDEKFLIGAHIARWADAEHIQGETSNGLCLCLMHDKAFEIGFFTIDAQYKISINEKYRSNDWCNSHLAPYDGEQIKLGEITPSLEALKYHWDRINFNPRLNQ